MGVIRYGSGKPISKTIDIGTNGVAVSADQRGTIHQITAFHPKHGLVLAEPYSQFDGTKFHDSSYVRKYRARMLDSIRTESAGIGFRIERQNQNINIDFEGLGGVRVSTKSTGGISVVTRISASQNGEVVQQCKVLNEGLSSQPVRWRLNLGISLNRASYGQLTEGGPIPLPRSSNELEIAELDNDFRISNTHLGAQLQGSVLDPTQTLNLRSDLTPGTYSDSPVKAEGAGEVLLEPGIAQLFELRLLLMPISMPPAISSSATPEKASQLAFWKGAENQAQFILRRNLEYILGNCAVPLSSVSDAVCLITDHVALPLGWNRDNYWQAQFLVNVYRHLQEIGDPASIQYYLPIIKRTLRGHLTWCFKHAQRPSKYWHRSYLVTGKPKDGFVFQLDQQCYPLLLLCDLLECFPEDQAFISGLALAGVIPEILRVIEQKKDPVTGLVPTEETPGDDEVEWPYHFSSHVLLWYTYSKLSKLARTLGMQDKLHVTQLDQNAEAVKAATLKHFLVKSGSGGDFIFAYLTNGDGLWKKYHDANDIPTLFAHAWGFSQTAVEIEAWHNTMTFGWSSANQGGYYGGGQFAGLGSVHTPAPWPLGYFQMWRFAQMVDDRKLEEESWEKICGSMQWDGLFSEAVNVETGECVSKAWFCWPGAMIGSGLLQDGVRERYL